MTGFLIHKSPPSSINQVGISLKPLKQRVIRKWLHFTSLISTGFSSSTISSIVPANSAWNTVNAAISILAPLLVLH